MKESIFIPQKKHLMVSVSLDQSSMHGIKFISSFFHNKKEMSITLFYVSPAPVRNDMSCMTDTWESKDAPPIIPTQIRSTMSYCINYLVKHGFSKENIIQQSVTKKRSTVQDLIHSAQNGRYDSLVLGKRGSSFLENALTGSVSNDLLEMNLNFPLWICREPEEKRQDVLLCIDGSKSSLRAADHIGYILNDQHEHTITILNIDNNHGLGHKKVFGEIFSQLTKSGISPDRIFQKIIKSMRVTSAIHEEIEDNHYAVVAFGWTGTTPRNIKSFVAGSKSRDLIQDLTKTSLWVIK